MQPYTPVPRFGLRQDRHAQELTVVANFAEVWLAKQGHQGLVGVNYLDKIRMAMPAAAYGVMLVGVDVVLAGAGIPRELPMLLNTLARHEPVSLQESGLRADLRSRLLGQLKDGTLHVHTDPVASPTGFPFKVARLPGTLSDEERHRLPVPGRAGTHLFQKGR